jgi:flagellar basal-body rod protein FlgC
MKEGAKVKMRLFQSIVTSATGLTAERLRMDIIAGNIANAKTTRTGRVEANGDQIPYRRKLPVYAERSPASSFQDILGKEMAAGNGVDVQAIVEDQSDFKLEYNPHHPDANAEGYVRMPNVDTVVEMVDLISASRAYEANVAAINAAKAMAMKALEIGS